MSAPCMDCPACGEPAVAATWHRCHDCRALEVDDHDPWCDATPCTDLDCEDWTWRYQETTCASCGVAVRISDESDAGCAEIETVS